jgi:para-aminobenzoate synthetase component 1
MLSKARYFLEDPDLFVTKTIHFLAGENPCMILNSNEKSRKDPYQKYDFLAAFHPISQFEIKSDYYESNLIEEFIAWTQDKQWLFGGFSYDLKNRLESLSSKNEDYFGGSDLLFFQPGSVIAIKENTLDVYALNDAQQLFTIISGVQVSDESLRPELDLNQNMQALCKKVNYISAVEQAREHIIAGDIYEINFCQAFKAEGNIPNPLGLYINLNELSPSPFSAYFAWKEFYLICASPERFLAKRGQTLIAQPIKGTRKRGNSPEEDDALAKALYESEKDRAENIMIVDLMRNDLSRSCIAGSVEVPELYGIYRFKRVMQMISTVTGVLAENENGLRALLKAFPMGSMTGAPKIRSMQIIDKLEVFKRSWFSGSFGYIDPDSDFDFNVVIRSLLYNQISKQIILPVGGAIVYDSDPEDEYNETLLKAAPALQLLENGGKV